MSQNKIQKLAKTCANFLDGGKCLLEPNRQPYCNFYRQDEQAQAYKDDMRCLYFEKYVLPSHPEVEAEYFNLNTAKCTECGAEYEKRSNRQKYCPECSAQKRRERSRNSMRQARDVAVF